MFNNVSAQILDVVTTGLSSLLPMLEPHLEAIGKAIVHAATMIFNNEGAAYSIGMLITSGIFGIVLGIIYGAIGSIYVLTLRLGGKFIIRFIGRLITNTGLFKYVWEKVLEVAKSAISSSISAALQWLKARAKDAGV